MSRILMAITHQPTLFFSIQAGLILPKTRSNGHFPAADESPAEISSVARRMGDTVSCLMGHKYSYHQTLH